MAWKHEILCINKSDRMNHHERIINVGGKNTDGTKWKISQHDAIIAIESKQWEFYVRKDSHIIKVIVAMSPYGHKYIKTENDGDSPDNLLSFPECS